jgi:hypothetical protein
VEFGALPQTPKIKTRKRFYSAPIPCAFPSVATSFKLWAAESKPEEEIFNREVEKVE